MNPDGTINRAHLAQAVFNDPAALARLNRHRLHPAVHNRAQQRFREIGAQNPHAVVIYVAAILVETDAWRNYDRLIVVDCSRKSQIERALKRPNATPADVEARMDRQLPSEKKREYAHYVIDTNGTKEETQRQTKMVFDELSRRVIN